MKIFCDHITTGSHVKLSEKNFQIRTYHKARTLITKKLLTIKDHL